MILRLESNGSWIEIDPVKNLQKYEYKHLGTHSGGWVPISMISYVKRSIDDFIESRYSIGYISVNMTSCCGGKGGERWDVDKAQWSCRDCGMVKSNDPNYIYSTQRPEYENDPIVFDLPEYNIKKCECGSTTLGSDKHSGYCPMYKA